MRAVVLAGPCMGTAGYRNEGLRSQHYSVPDVQHLKHPPDYQRKAP